MKRVSWNHDICQYKSPPPQATSSDDDDDDLPFQELQLEQAGFLVSPSNNNNNNAINVPTQNHTMYQARPNLQTFLMESPMMMQQQQQNNNTNLMEWDEEEGLTDESSPTKNSSPRWFTFTTSQDDEHDNDQDPIHLFHVVHSPSDHSKSTITTASSMRETPLKEYVDRESLERNKLMQSWWLQPTGSVLPVDTPEEGSQKKSNNKPYQVADMEATVSVSSDEMDEEEHDDDGDSSMSTEIATTRRCRHTRCCLLWLAFLVALATIVALSWRLRTVQQQKQAMHDDDVDDTTFNDSSIPTWSPSVAPQLESELVVPTMMPSLQPTIQTTTAPPSPAPTTTPTFTPTTPPTQALPTLPPTILSIPPTLQPTTPRATLSPTRIEGLAPSSPTLYPTMSPTTTEPTTVPPTIIEQNVPAFPPHIKTFHPTTVEPEETPYPTLPLVWIWPTPEETKSQNLFQRSDGP